MEYLFIEISLPLVGSHGLAPDFDHNCRSRRGRLSRQGGRQKLESAKKQQCETCVLVVNVFDFLLAMKDLVRSRIE
jgi:hypothetical protein